MKKLIITSQIYPLEKNFSSIADEALNIEDNILFNGNLQDEMKYHWIDYLMPLPSDRLDSPFLHSKILIMSSNERFRQQNAQLIKFQVLYFLLGIEKDTKRTFFSFLDT